MLVRYDTTGASGNRTWHQRADLPPQPLPTDDALRAAHRALTGSRRRMAYLCGQRGLSRAQIARHLLGYSGGYTFPVRGEGGELLTVVTHCPWFDGDGRYDVPRGSRAALYPTLPDGEACILVAGMFDALIARQYGLPMVVTTTSGARPASELLAQFVGRRVAVVFDAGEEDDAQRVVDRLPCEAWAVHLPLPEGGDVSDWFVKHKRTREELLKLISKARPTEEQ